MTGDRRPPLVFDDPFVTLDDERATRALALLKRVADDFQIIYLTTSDRYDGAAHAVVELPGPATVDDGVDDPARPVETAAGGRLIDGLPPGVLTVGFGLAAAVAWGAGDFGGGLASAGGCPVYGVVLVSQATGAVLCVALALILGEPFPTGRTSSSARSRASWVRSGSRCCTAARDRPDGHRRAGHRRPGRGDPGRRRVR